MAETEPRHVEGATLERGERALIPPEQGLSITAPMTVHIIPQTHIDVIWYWPVSETVRMVLATFRAHVQLLEADPARTFCQSQMALFEIVRLEDPPLFERIKIWSGKAAGRWSGANGWSPQSFSPAPRRMSASS